MGTLRKGRDPTQVGDACAACDRPIWVRFIHWPIVDGLWALLECANFCCDECEEYGRLDPEEVAERLRERKALRERHLQHAG